MGQESLIAASSPPPLWSEEYVCLKVEAAGRPQRMVILKPSCAGGWWCVSRVSQCVRSEYSEYVQNLPQLVQRDMIPAYEKNGFDLTD